MIVTSCIYIYLGSSRVEVVIIEETVSRIGSAAGRVPQDWKRQLRTRRKNQFSKDSNVISIKLSIIKLYILVCVVE